MSIGTIIFIITIVISIISAIGDKSHKDRQKKNKPNQPQSPSSNQPEEKETFFDKVEKKLNELEDQYSEPQTKEVVEQTDYEPPKEPKQQTTSPSLEPSNTVSSKQQQDEENKKALQALYEMQLSQLDREFDQAHKKEKAKIEQRALRIMNDPQLSHRTKRMKLEQLNVREAVKSSNKAMTFSENPVVNGIIWSEVIQKRKEL
ncbi:hypothetical protein [Staphylococcus sp. 11261D007BR]